MREILFKGKSLLSGEWVEGHYAFDECALIIQSLQYRLENGRPNFVEVYPVIPSTVCEYTGLTDSDGKRVFDGDILKFYDEPNDYEWIGRVEFGNPNGSYTWGWQLVHISGPKPNIDTLCWFDMEEVGVYSEVIGNKFDGGKDDS